MSLASELLKRVRAHDFNSKPMKQYFSKLDKVAGKWRVYRTHKDGSITSDGRTYTTQFAANLQRDAYNHLEHVTGQPHTLDGTQWPGYVDDNQETPQVPLGSVVGS